MRKEYSFFYLFNVFTKNKKFNNIEKRRKRNKLNNEHDKE